MMQVKDFWPRYWGGVVLHDRNMEFFKALGGGEPLKDKFISGFIFNPRAIANYRRAKAMGIKQNFKGEGEIKGGLFIVGGGRSGIAYQFIERNFGDWAPPAEVIEICTQLQVSPVVIPYVSLVGFHFFFFLSKEKKNESHQRIQQHHQGQLSLI